MHADIIREATRTALTTQRGSRGNGRRKREREQARRTRSGTVRARVVWWARERERTLKAGEAPATMLQNTQRPPPDGFPTPSAVSPAAQGDAKKPAPASAAAAAVPRRSAVEGGRRWARSTARRRSGAGVSDGGVIRGRRRARLWEFARGGVGEEEDKKGGGR
jgi:hypothetical protein